MQFSLSLNQCLGGYRRLSPFVSRALTPLRLSFSPHACVCLSCVCACLFVRVCPCCVCRRVVCVPQCVSYALAFVGVRFYLMCAMCVCMCFVGVRVRACWSMCLSVCVLQREFVSAGREREAHKGERGAHPHGAAAAGAVHQGMQDGCPGGEGRGQ